ncbi:MAG: cupin domain-containing protein [Alphaproteobacteria bacterium]
MDAAEDLRSLIGRAARAWRARSARTAPSAPASRRTRSILVRMEPGARFAAHGHPVTEECLVLEGEMVIGGVRFVAGDYHLAPKGLPHPEVSSPRGGVIFVRCALEEAA